MKLKLEPGASLIVYVCMYMHIYLYTHKWDSHPASSIDYNKVGEMRAKTKKKKKKKNSKETHKLKRLFEIAKKKKKNEWMNESKKRRERGKNAEEEKKLINIISIAKWEYICEKE